MQERVLSKKKNGMAVLCGILLLYVISIIGIYFGAVNAYSTIIFFSIFLMVVTESFKAAGSISTHIVWKVCGHIEGRWFLFCKSVLF